VECGVFAGTHPAMMACAVMDCSQQSVRRVHLFDTFDGVPEIGERDKFKSAQVAQQLRDQTKCALQIVQDYMEEWGIPADLLVYHEGRLEETLPPLSLFPIALLRIDCDLYDGTQAVLRYLYPSVSERGITVMDDYAFEGCRLAFQETLDAQTISQIAWRKRT